MDATTIKARPASIHPWKTENPGLFLHVAHDLDDKTTEYYSVPIAGATPQSLVQALIERGATGVSLVPVPGKAGFTVKGGPMLKITGRVETEEVKVTDAVTGVERTETNRTIWIDAGGIEIQKVTALADAFAA